MILIQLVGSLEVSLDTGYTISGQLEKFGIKPDNSTDKSMFGVTKYVTEVIRDNEIFQTEFCPENCKIQNRKMKSALNQWLNATGISNSFGSRTNCMNTTVSVWSNGHVQEG